MTAPRAGKWVVERHAGDPGRWDAFVMGSPQAHPFATSAWLEASAHEAGAALDRWIVRKGDEWVAAFPVPSRSAFGQRFYVGLPLAAYSSLLYRPPASPRESRTIAERHEVTQALLTVLEAEYRSMDWLLTPDLSDVRPWIWRGWRAVPRYTAILDLEHDFEPSEAARRHVRKGQEAGLRLSMKWDFDAFMLAFSGTSRRQGFDLGLPVPAVHRLAGRLYERGLAWMTTVLETDGRVAASQIVLALPPPGGVYMWIAGTRTDLLARGVSTWHMLETAAEARRRGHRSWDLCGADMPGVARFKGELGARLRNYMQVRAPLGPAEWAQHAVRRIRKALRPSTAPGRA